MAQPRRRFLLQLASLVPVPFVARRIHQLAASELDPRVLRALAALVLPSELGRNGVERVVGGFERWLAGYREGVELVHGYGTGELRRTGPSPALRWSTQVSALARQSFHAMAPEEQRRVVLQGLTGVRPGGSLLQFDRAPHIALGLIGYFYSLPEATDLCYQARIGPNTCRPLATSSRKPLPLAETG
jgi:hypothetical protein